MNFSNSYRIYLVLMEKHKAGRHPLLMSEGINEATHAFLQKGEGVRKRAPDPLLPIRHMMRVYDTGCGKKKRTDAKGVATTRTRTRTKNV